MECISLNSSLQNLKPVFLQRYARSMVQTTERNTEMQSVSVIFVETFLENGSNFKKGEVGGWGLVGEGSDSR